MHTKIHTHKFERTVKRTAITVGIMLALAIIGGVLYVYFTDKNAAQTLPPPAVVPEVKAPIAKPTEPGPNAPNSASVQFIDTPVKAGSETSITVTTGQRADCKIAVSYGSIVGKDPGLIPKAADLYGSVSWQWVVDKAAAPGRYTVRVTCERNKKIAYVEGYLEVIK